MATREARRHSMRSCVGNCEGDRSIYVARTRHGFTPVTRAQLFKKIQRLEIDECPFANLLKAKSGRWGQGLTKAKMAEVRWLKPARRPVRVVGVDLQPPAALEVNRPAGGQESTGRRARVTQVIQLDSLGLGANFAYVFFGDPAALDRARLAIHQRLARAAPPRPARRPGRGASTPAKAMRQGKGG